jgi:hypothetical protein
MFVLTIRIALLFVLCAVCGFAQQFNLGEPLTRELPKQAAPPAAASDASIPAGSWYDTTNRTAIAQAYIGDYLPTRSIPSSWTGNVTAGNAGDVSQVYRTAVAQRINWYRAMAGVPAWVTFDATFNARAQKGALMLAANQALTHTPPPTWIHYTADGAEALGKSNICQGFESDPGCIELYIADQGTNNTAVGHRRWFLYPQTKLMGTGDVPHDGNLWNAVWVFDNNFGGLRPTTREEFVAWPPKGYVPYQVVFPRWSFSYPNANFSSATVTMTRGGQPLPVRVESNAANIGENSIVWVPENQSVTDWLNPTPPASDTTYTVTIGNVLAGGQTRSFTYNVIVFNPEAGPVFTADPPAVSFPTGGGDGELRLFKDPPSASATAVSSSNWITIKSGPFTYPFGTYFFYTVAANTGPARSGTITVGNAIHTIHQAGTGGGAGGGSGSGTLSVNRTSLVFGTVENSGTFFTRAQDVQVNLTGAGAASTVWTASSSQPWLAVTPSIGVGSGTFKLSLVPINVPVSGTYSATVTVSAPGASGSPKAIAVSLTVVPRTTSVPPFGVVDEPKNGETNRYGAIGVTGWALDNTEVVRVSLWRNPIGAEPVHPNGHVYIGDAVFLDGARPDVAAAYPTYPINTRAGWGLQVLTNMLPNSNGQPGTGNGTYTFHVYAHDREGLTKLLGSPAISVNNAGATRPFGTLDTPGNGQEVSGTVTVFGWALTPQPGIIPTNGSTIIVYVDGVSQGPVNGYHQFRPDIANLFPGYNNSNGAVGYYHLDTTKLTDGLHRIAWSVTDNLGRIEGIGSRLFWVRNSGTPANAGGEATEAKRQ